MAERKFCVFCGGEGHRSHTCPRRPRERDVEKHLVDSVKALGGIAYKFTSPGRVGVPDRLVVLPAREVKKWDGKLAPGAICAAEGWVVPARLFFAELKAPGRTATAGQAREHDRLRSLGQDVYVLDSHVAIDALLEVM